VLVAAALVPSGHIVAAALALGALTVVDSLDGVLARLAGTDSPWGAFVDSATDRVVDGTILASIALYAHLHLADGDRTLVLVAALVALVLDQLVPYAKARGQAEGFDVSGGIAQRADRLVLVLVGLFAHGLGAPAWVLAAILALTALLAVVTVGQRVAGIRRQALAAPGAES
jgi:CDP-diacylglycerol--glycerol-3-phosphate 3-phosphatidyltransferase